MATVTECNYETGAGRALAFGIPTSRHFRITFNYWAPGTNGASTQYTGDFMSAKAIPQGELFSIHYNPAAPHDHNRSGGASASRSPVIVFGILGSVALSLAWFAILRGCH